MRPRSGNLAGPWIWLATILIAIDNGPAYSQQEPAVLAGVRYLKQHGHHGAGESAMIALGLLKAEVPTSDPVLMSCVDRFRARFTSGSYEPERPSGPAIYEAAAAAMALANLDAAAHRHELTMIANYILSEQRPGGAWDYSGRDFGDTSITQYAILGLWEAENAGVEMSPSVWERAASWYLKNQHANGAWVYHNDEAQYNETLSMTAAGVGSLLICQRQLDRYRQDRRETSSLLKALSADPHNDFKPSIPNQQIDQAVRHGMEWISGHFAPDKTIAGPSPFYMLYGIERIGALAERQTIGRLDWFERGRAYIRANQQNRRLLAGCARDRDEHGLGHAVLDQVDGQDLEAHPHPAAGGGHAPRWARAADGPVVHDCGRRARREPSHERCDRGDARRAGRPPRGTGRRGRGRTGRPVLPRGPGRAPAVQDAVPEDAHRSRPRRSAGSPPGHWPIPATWMSSLR